VVIREVDDQSVEGNTRVTVNFAVILFVLLAVEGLTIVAVRPLLTWHVAVGLVLTPPLLAKIGSTSWRIVRYYTGSTPYTRKGPPPLLLRLLGPFIVLLSVVVVASGIALILVASSSTWGQRFFFVHKASFILWFVATSVHVLGHIVDTAREAPGDWFPAGRRAVRGAPARLWLVASSLVLGALLALWLTPHAAHWVFYGDQ